ncbi:MAG: hypothetical protein V7K47_19375, partial [Nostoc sp.]
QLLTELTSIVITTSFQSPQQLFLFYIKEEDLHKFNHRIKQIYSLVQKSSFMAEPTITEIFGTGATRLASGAATPSAGLFIPDSAFVTAGLATPTTASAEGHFAAIALNAQSYLTQTNFDANTDQSIYIAKGFSSFTTRGNDDYRVDQLTISLAKIDSTATIDPDNY